MCGIFGFSGELPVTEVLINGLRRLEYRGYDSWGISFLEGEELQLHKQVGKLPEEVKIISKQNDGRRRGIAHTRWATHGGVTEANTHPHFASDKSFALAQNGIVENYQELKQELKDKGHQFITETDTEVIVRLIEEELKSAEDLMTAVVKAFNKLEGRNTIIIISANSGEIIAIKNGSPLVVGKSEDNIFIGSDYLSFSNYTNKIMEMDHNTGVKIVDDKVEKFSIDEKGFQFIEASFASIDEEFEEVDKGGYPDFMLKEIHEQPQTILNATSYTEEDILPLARAIQQADNVYTIGCGTASYAAGQIAYYLRKYANIRATELKGYEVDSYKNLFSSDDLMVAISQSGETIDTLEPIEFMQEKGGKVASLVNMLGSTITKISDYPYYNRTGPEICVASTKAFTAQLAWGYLLSQTLIGNFESAKKEIRQTGEAMKVLLNNRDNKAVISRIVDYCKDHDHFFVLGRGQNFYIALEGALKIKEITYKHFEGFAAGELKHGVIALVEEGTPVFVVLSEDENKADMLSAVAEVKSRGAKVIAIAPEDNDLFDHHIKVEELAHTSALVNVLPFQVISHDLGLALGNDVDKPRNLAKSVTVK
jgi:glucosamine--fructose-6-phosphate aminotransferase (isomerizing)